MTNIFNKIISRKANSKKIVIQTETTGFAPEEGHKLVEIAAIEIDENDIQTGNVFHAYINPGRTVPEEIIAIHGLDSDFLMNYQTFPAYKDEFLHFIKGKDLIGNNIKYDLSFLNNEVGVKLSNKITDTLEMAREAFPNQKNNLTALCERLDIKFLHSPYNGALLDALRIYKVYKKLKTFL